MNQHNARVATTACFGLLLGALAVPTTAASEDTGYLYTCTRGNGGIIHQSTPCAPGEEVSPPQRTVNGVAQGRPFGGQDAPSAPVSHDLNARVTAPVEPDAGTAEPPRIEPPENGLPKGNTAGAVFAIGAGIVAKMRGRSFWKSFFIALGIVVAVSVLVSERARSSQKSDQPALQTRLHVIVAAA